MKKNTIFELPYRLVALSGQREAVTRWRFFFNCIILTANIMEEEVWKDIPDYENRYQISNYGRVYSLAKVPFIMKLRDNGNGYKLVGLTKNNKSKNKYIHKLVAISFIPNPLNYPQVNHIDGIKNNNYFENLEWCNQSQNNIHAYKNGLRLPTGACVVGRIDPKRKAVYKLSLDGKILEEYNSIAEAALKNNITQSWVSRVCNGKNYFVHGFTYKFKN